MATDDMKPLPSVVPGSLTQRERLKPSVLLDERIGLTEAIALASQIVACYPTADKVGDGYIGGLAHTLANYPASVARQCADLKQGIMRFAKFLPSVAEIVNYCEGFTEPLRRQVDIESRRTQQFKDRDEFLHRERVVRPKRLTIQQLKEKYGDWHHNFRKPGEFEREQRQKAYDALVTEFGKDAVDAVPDAKPKLPDDPFAGLE